MTGRQRAHEVIAKAEHTLTLPGISRLFEQDWWLDAAAPNAWGRVEERWDNVLVGAMPFAVRKRAGIQFIELPPYTRTLSPTLLVPTHQPARQIASRVKILEALFQKLPRHQRFEMCLRPDCETVLPFVLLNCAVAHTFTFRSALGERALDRMHPKTRNIVRKSQREFVVQESRDIERFLGIARAQFRSDHRADPNTIRRLHAATRMRNCSTVLVAVNEDGVDCAACVLIWDDDTMYYWLSARDPSQSPTGANTVLIAKALELANQLQVTLDLDGFVTKGAGLYLSKFGLTPTVRPVVNKSGAVWKAMNLVSSLRAGRLDSHYRF